MIQEHCQATQENPAIIEVHIDEFQQSLSPEDLELLSTGSSNKSSIPFRRFCEALMNLVKVAASYHVYIIPVCTGTLSITYLDLFPRSKFDHLVIHLAPEKIKDVKSAVLAALSHPKFEQLRANPQFEDLLKATGGVWRAVESLVQIVKSLEDPSNTNINNIWSLLCSKVEARWKIRQGEKTELLKQLARYTLTGKSITASDSIAGIPVAQLMLDGYIFLEELRDYAQPTYRVDMPYIFLTLYSTLFTDSDIESFLLKQLISRHHLYPQVDAGGFEHLIREYERYKVQGYQLLGATTVKMGELHRGAELAPEFKFLSVSLTEPMVAAWAKDESFPESVKVSQSALLVDIMGANSINLLHKPVAMWIGRSCPTCDNLMAYHLNSQLISHALLGLEHKFSIPEQLTDDPRVSYCLHLFI